MSVSVSPGFFRIGYSDYDMGLVSRHQSAVITLSFAFVVLLAGCGGGGVETPASTEPSTGTPTQTATIDAPTETPTESSTETPTPTVTPIEPPPCPEKPDNLTADSAARFAVAFEEAYTTRETLAGESFLTYHSLNGLPNPPSGATAVDDGYLYEFGVWEAYTTKYATGDSWYDVRYFISNQSVYRIQGEESDEQLPDPRENGTAVTCPLTDEN
jgi:hypothetical protein